MEQTFVKNQGRCSLFWLYATRLSAATSIFLYPQHWGNSPWVARGNQSCTLHGVQRDGCCRCAREIENKKNGHLKNSRRSRVQRFTRLWRRRRRPGFRGSRFNFRSRAAFGMSIYKKRLFLTGLINNLGPNWQLLEKMTMFNEDFGSSTLSLPLTLNVEPWTC